MKLLTSISVLLLCTIWLFADTSHNSTIYLHIKVFLYGPYNTTTSLMNDDLRQCGIIPNTDPYFGIYVAGAGVFNTTGNNAIVDWVKVEIRSPIFPHMILASRAALLQRDGDAVDVDGVSSLSFPGVPSGSYYVAVSHRNHLGVMTNFAVLINNSPSATVIDFTTMPDASTYGTYSQQDMGGGLHALWAGDANGDGCISYNGTTCPCSSLNTDNADLKAEVINHGSTAPNPLTYVFKEYSSFDIDMDGCISYDGTAYYDPIFGIKITQQGNAYLLNQIMIHPDNSSPTPTFVFKEQIP